MAWRRRAQDDFASEIRSHLELETTRLIDEGLSPDEARAAARRRFGNVTAANERFYESDRWLWWDHLRHEVCAATRSVRRYPLSAVGGDRAAIRHCGRHRAGPVRNAAAARQPARNDRFVRSRTAAVAS